MILTKLKSSCSILNKTEELELNGNVTLENQELKLDAQILDLSGNYLGTALYIYRNSGWCAKSISDIDRSYMLQANEVLENTVSFLIQELNMS